MRKIITLIAVLAFILSIQSYAQVQFGIKGGLNLAKITLRDLGGATQKIKPSYNIGAIVNYDMASNLTMETGLFISGKGTKLESSSSDGGVSIKAKENVSPLYLEIPINAVYKIDLGTSQLRLFAGPYLAFGIAGKYKVEYSATGLPAGTTLETYGISNSSDDLKFGTDVDSDLKPTDFGFNIGAGIQMSNIMISAQYGLGLTNIDTSTSNDNEKKNKVIGITAGFLFGGK